MSARPMRLPAALVALVVFGWVASSCGMTADPTLVPPPRATPAASPTAAPTPRQTPLSVSVAGQPVSYASGLTVAAALSAVGVVVRDGRLLSVVEHRVLDAHHSPGVIRVDGRVATLRTLLSPGDSVTVEPGDDSTESTRTATLAVAADPTGTGLYVGGRPGAARAVVGTVSGEVVSETIVRLPVLGHLTRPGTLAVTLDDGPDAVWTPQILVVLAARGAHATFCLIGREVPRLPGLVRAERAAGHALCNHTESHDQALPTRTVEVIHSQIAQASAAIADAAGVRPTLFRAPGGNWSPLVEHEAAALGMTPLRWTVDPRDWSDPGTTAIVMRVLRAVRPGGTLLLHDGGGDRSQTVKALGVLLDQLGAAGYVFVVPSQG
jgi:peptidoglycan/xylan/chitin deacetylase (PgdA/CDA1 family)